MEMIESKLIKILKGMFLGTHIVNKETILNFILAAAKADGEDEEEIRWLKRRKKEDIIDIRFDIEIDIRFDIESSHIGCSLTQDFLESFIETMIHDSLEDIDLHIRWKSGDRSDFISIVEYILLVGDFSVEELDLIINGEDEETNYFQSCLSGKEVLYLNKNLSKEAKVFLELN